MIENITLKFSEGKKLSIAAQGVTIFVGPNNSGKSLLLREFEQAFKTNALLETKLFDDYELAWPDKSQFQDDIERLRRLNPTNVRLEEILIGRYDPSGGFDSGQVKLKNLFSMFDRHEKRWLASQFFRFFQLRLDGRTRFDLTNDRPAGDLLLRPQNLLQHIFADDAIREEISQIVFDAFGFYLVIEPLNLGTLRIRLSLTKPAHDEQSLDKSARDFHQKAVHVRDASDGVQAFVGIVIAVLSGDYRSILIDEPEAFLHPPLARKLGYRLAQTASKRAGSLMASTHSADFLLGCLHGATDVRVVRLEYSNGKSRGRIVDADALRTFFRAPLIRSANVVSALFHDGVVVTESDNDRAFYYEVYQRIAEREPNSPSLLFVNAQNKQTIMDIIGPLRAFGVPAAAIVDIDILKDGGATWQGWLKSANIPPALHGGLGQTRGDIYKRFIESNVNMKTDGGVCALDEKDRAAANDLLDVLDQYGIFVTRQGELENWLADLGVTGKKTSWTIAMLERLGSDPLTADYVQPANADVWGFLRRIVRWIKESTRKGID